jgi:hypothetical protein
VAARATALAVAAVLRARRPTRLSLPPPDPSTAPTVPSLSPKLADGSHISHPVRLHQRMEKMVDSTWPSLSFQLEGCGVELRSRTCFAREELERDATRRKEMRQDAAVRSPPPPVRRAPTTTAKATRWRPAARGGEEEDREAPS